MMKQKLTVERSSTVFLRLAVSVIGLGVLALCIFLLPLIWAGAYDEYPQQGYAARAIVAVMYASAVPFYIGIYKGWRVLDAVDRRRSFSLQPVRALRVIAWCAGVISFLYLLSLPFFYIVTDLVDAPGLMVIGMFLVGMPLIISVAMGLLARLLGEAVRIKSENDMTV